ncbi:MAG: MFS transporter [Actinobacteria bacterium]|nr:MFS transporter [Actinomycetota bacterium]
MLKDIKPVSSIIILVSIGIFMSALDSSIVNISLPVISRYFTAPMTSVEWIVLSYLIIITSLLLTFGKLGDLYGHKKIFNTGLVIFTAGSLFCSLSPTLLLLIVSRVIQALGAGMLMSMGPAIITINTSPSRRGKYLGIIAMSVSVALIAGPVLGGFLTTYFGWQSIFYINIPIGITAFIWALKSLPASRLTAAARFDFAGAGLLFISLLLIVFPLSYGDRAGWSNPFVIGSLASGVFLFIAFFFAESRIKNPMLDPGLFKSRLFSMANLSLLINFMAQFCVTFIMPFYLIDFRKFSPSKAGLILIAAPAVVMIIAPLAGYLSDKIDARYISSAGMAVSSAGLFLLSTLKEDTAIFAIIAFLSITAIGFGFFQTPNNSAIMGSVPPDRRGIASSMIATMRNMGMVFGVAISGSIFSSRFDFLTEALSLEGLGESAVLSHAYSGAMETTFIVAASLSCIAVFTSLIRGSLKSGK